jgi:4-aminobutyrate aminotransferase-like enzyme
VAEVRAAGGLFIADEVQPGFGRTGSHMWGFARHGIVPDLVTLGKPMGNGHPIGAMAARSDLMTTFSKLSRYFNTFGGNTVSCAVAMAVLDVIEQEDLMGNARTVGARLGAGLADLADRYPNLGAVRGAGLYYGVDIRPNPAKGLDAIEEALRIVNGMRERGVLISTPSGRGAPSLKIRPPLPFAVEHVEILLTRMEQVLNA